MPISVPFPRSIPFSICVPTARHRYCVSAQDLVFGGRRDCIGGQTPPLVSASASISEEELTLTGYDTISTYSLWVGIEENINAIWLGDSAQNCTRIPVGDPPNPTESVDDLVDDLRSYQSDVANAVEDLGGPERGSTGSDIIVIILLVIIAIIIIASRGRLRPA
ncbi:hypothetical protein [Natronolimnohabitans innermongolicus]|uniref:hypothetical protein n=1 Tax=Natronolimnohabitans innermongolicus TaxID=253107 RepID=UPI00126848EB|nr:hypothetical protein [Natronolimnohabitans innermongolicus]